MHLISAGGLGEAILLATSMVSAWLFGKDASSGASVWSLGVATAVQIKDGGGKEISV